MADGVTSVNERTQNTWLPMKLLRGLCYLPILSATTSSAFEVKGRNRLVDDCGRTLLFHGVNVSGGACYPRKVLFRYIKVTYFALSFTTMRMFHCKGGPETPTLLALARGRPFRSKLSHGCGLRAYAGSWL